MPSQCASAAHGPSQTLQTSGPRPATSHANQSSSLIRRRRISSNTSPDRNSDASTAAMRMGCSMKLPPDAADATTAPRDAHPRDAARCHLGSAAIHAKAQLPRGQKGQEYLLTRHLGAAMAALREHDRHLDQRETPAEDAVLELDQERVSVGADPIEADPLQGGATDAL